MTKKKNFDLESIFKFMKKLSYLSDFRVFGSYPVDIKLSIQYHTIQTSSHYYIKLVKSFKKSFKDIIGENLIETFLWKNIFLYLKKKFFEMYH